MDDEKANDLRWSGVHGGYESAVRAALLAGTNANAREHVLNRTSLHHAAIQANQETADA